MALRMQVIKIRTRHKGFFLLRQTFMHREEPIWFFKTQWVKQYRFHHAEDCGIGADSQREREYGGDGEAAIAAEHAPPVDEILKDGLHPTAAANFIALFAYVREVAKALLRITPGILRNHAPANVFSS